MLKVFAVIGANYGDEGKGLMTHYFSKKYHARDPLVVRFNGGAQAGHTVYQNGKRYVFSHFGSGTLTGAPTYLSEYFVCNPLVFRKEREELVSNNIYPSAVVNAKCQITTVFDILYNQKLEQLRGEGRHGSCGLGFNATIERSLAIPFTVADLFGSSSYLTEKLTMIQNFYLKLLSQHSVNVDDIRDTSIIRKNKLECDYFMDSIDIAASNEIIRERDCVIFEGAQGLLLDMDSVEFPHITRSKTGTTNVKKILDSCPYLKYNIECVYVTRPYLTRHGAGPIKEWPVQGKFNIVDETNVPNAFQGSMRYGLIDIHEIREGGYFDSRMRFGNIYESGCERFTSFALTCFDQVGENIPYLNRGQLLTTTKQGFRDMNMFMYISNSNDGEQVDVRD